MLVLGVTHNGFLRGKSPKGVSKDCSEKICDV